VARLKAKFAIDGGLASTQPYIVESLIFRNWQSCACRLRDEVRAPEHDRFRAPGSTAGRSVWAARPRPVPAGWLQVGHPMKW
jgi:hypothetical protein